MRLIVTTVVRDSLLGKQKTGFIYDVDWDRRQVLRRLPVPEPTVPESDANPRGGIRGGRGVAVTPQGILVANYDTIYLYDDDWRELDARSHRLFVGIHEVHWDGRHLWVTATAIDAVLKTGPGEPVEVAWDPHSPAAASVLGLRSRRHPLSGAIDFRTGGAPRVDDCHINSVTPQFGGMVVNCGLVQKPRSRVERAGQLLSRGLRRSLQTRAAFRLWRELGAGMGPAAPSPGDCRSLVVRVSNSNGSLPEVLLELDGHSLATHNGRLLDDSRIVVNDSTTNSLRVFDLADQSELANVAVPGTWLRGLTPVGPAQVLVGTAPATVALVDLDTGSVEEQLQLSTDPNEAVHGLTVCPPPGERL